MNRMRKIISALALTASLVACGKNVDDIAEYIYINGNIITINDLQPSAEALAIKDGIILAVGDNEEVLASQGSTTEIIDLEGVTVVPGFIDAHSHFAGVGTQAIVANLLPAPDGPVNSIAQLQAVMRDYIANSDIVDEYDVALGFNYDDSQLVEARHPTRHELDAITTEIPLMIMHQSGHLGVYNSRALEMMGITAATPDPSGGLIVRELDGVTPNGVMEENAHFMIFYRMIPAFTESDLLSLYKAGEYSFISNGFTTVQEGKTDLATLQTLPRIAVTNGFDVDIISYPDIAAIGAEAILNSGLVSSEYTSGFRIGGVKLTFDGSPQGKTAWFTQPYLEAPDGQSKDYSGYPAFTDEQALDWMQLAFENQWQLLVHTNGDAAIDQLIRLLEKLNSMIGGRDHRTVMIHGQFTRHDQIESLQDLGVFPALYPMHTFYWGDWHHDSVVGPERAQNISPTGWFVNEGMKFTVHSDAPVTFPNSMRILDSAVNRTSRSGMVLGEEHRLKPLDGLKAMTIWAAYQHFEEATKGSLEVGKQADMVLLDADPLRVEPQFIKDIKVLETINNGKSIYSYQ